MCQLLGMNCAAPTDFSFSLKGFCRRGGATDKHSHGWGTAIYEGRGLRCFHDTLPACKSPIAELIQNYSIRTYNMMAHIRYATQGEVSLENVHPFSRELWGIQWSFAHNGEVPMFTNVSADNVPLLGWTKCKDLHFSPVGDTDSEAVFCAILNALKAEFPEGLPTLPVLHEFLSYVCEEITHDHSNDTIFNFLLGCGQYTMFAYSWPGARPGSEVWNGLHYIIREPPFSTAKLLDVDYTIDFRTVTTPQDRVAVITTKPLTEEPGWREMKRGELLMFNRGKCYSTPKCCEAVEKEGGGLFSKYVKNKCNRSPHRFVVCPKSLPGAFSLDSPHARSEPSMAMQQQPFSLRDPMPPLSPTKPNSVLAASAALTEAAMANSSAAKGIETRMASLAV
uniref:Glutamine amidotransferase type-2 domain-containing protein n=1 Tax=Amphora coffeiformis TaxID=265554 RepID=A0A7S3PDV2_9STRA|mmetsp:Transcript_17761/g.35713  ORF Transcript_17761/g.35713 Transcript_17761/m.35713 type:complete len:393 (-) Transcript_17761:13-1191(-)